MLEGQNKLVHVLTDGSNQWDVPLILRKMHFTANVLSNILLEQNENKNQPRPSEWLPYNIIIMSKKEPLFVFSDIVNNTKSSHEIHQLPRAGVTEVIATLVASVTIHPLQSELGFGSCFRGHTCQVESATCQQQSTWNRCMETKLLSFPTRHFGRRRNSVTWSQKRTNEKTLLGLVHRDFALEY